MKKLKYYLSMVLVLIFIVGCGGSSLENTLTSGDGKWELTAEEETQNSMEFTFKASGKIAISYYGEVLETSYSVSKDADSIVIEGPEEGDSALTFKVSKYKKDKIEISEIDGEKGKAVLKKIK